MLKYVLREYLNSSKSAPKDGCLTHGGLLVKIKGDLIFWFQIT